MDRVKVPTPIYLVNSECCPRSPLSQKYLFVLAQICTLRGCKNVLAKIFFPNMSDLCPQTLLAVFQRCSRIKIRTTIISQLPKCYRKSSTKRKVRHDRDCNLTLQFLIKPMSKAVSINTILQKGKKRFQERFQDVPPLSMTITAAM